MPKKTKKSFTSVAETFSDYLLHERGLSWNTVVAYQRDLEDFSGFIEEYLGESLNIDTFADLEVYAFRAWLSARRARELSAVSTARALSSIKSFNRFCRLKGLRVNTSVDLVRSPKKPIILPRPLHESESYRLLEACAKQPTVWVAKRDVAVCLLLWGCGLRISEALQLQPKSFMRQDQCLRIQGKGNKFRLVPLLSVVRSAIESYQQHCPFNLESQDALFRGVRGKALRPRTVQTLIMRLRRELGMPEKVTPHALRHSFASDLLRGGGDLRTIQELLGHASLNSTQRYADIDRSALADIYRRTHQS